MNNKEEYSFSYKIILIGSSKVGKSQILNKYLNDIFKEKIRPTVQVDFYSKIIQKDKYTITLNISDIAGQEECKKLRSIYYGETKGCVVVYDITNKSSFDKVDEFINDFNEDIKVIDTGFILIGNKSDLEKERQVSKEEGVEKSNKYNISFLETSALSGDGIKEVFDKLVNDILKKDNKNI